MGAELSPSELGEIFDRCSDFSERIRTTQLYSMLHDKPELCGQLVNSLSEALQFEDSDQPSRVSFWLQGLCLISKQRDKDALFDALFEQITIFIAAQEHNLYRINNDKYRFLVLYLHFKAGIGMV